MHVVLRWSNLTADVLMEAVKLVTGPESLDVVDADEARLLLLVTLTLFDVPVDSDRDCMSLG